MLFDVCKESYAVLATGFAAPKTIVTLKVKVPCRCFNRCHRYGPSTMSILRQLRRVRAERVTFVFSPTEADGQCGQEYGQILAAELRSLTDIIESDTPEPRGTKDGLDWILLKLNATCVLALKHGKHNDFPKAVYAFHAMRHAEQ